MFTPPRMMRSLLRPVTRTKPSASRIGEVAGLDAGAADQARYEPSSRGSPTAQCGPPAVTSPSTSGGHRLALAVDDLEFLVQRRQPDRAHLLVSGDCRTSSRLPARPELNHYRARTWHVLLEAGWICGNRHYASKMGTVGLPALHQEFEIVDGEGKLCPPDVEGEVTAGGPHCAVGYLRDDGSIEPIRGKRIKSGDLADHGTRTASSASPAAPRTSSSAAASTSRRWRSTRSCSSIPASPMPRRSACRTKIYGEEVVCCVVARPGAGSDRGGGDRRTARRACRRRRCRSRSSSSRSCRRATAARCCATSSRTTGTQRMKLSA